MDSVKKSIQGQDLESLKTNLETISKMDPKKFTKCIEYALEEISEADDNNLKPYEILKYLLENSPINLFTVLDFTQSSNLGGSFTTYSIFDLVFEFMMENDEDRNLRFIFDLMRANLRHQFKCEIEFTGLLGFKELTTIV